MASELIIRLQRSDGRFNCEKFVNLPSSRSVYIAICFTDNGASEQFAKDLKRKLITSITNLNKAFVSSTPPCQGENIDFMDCQALGIVENIKLVIVVSDGLSDTFANNSILNWTGTILPILKYGTQISLPSPLNIPQVAFWNNHIDEVIPAIFGLIGISEEDQRIFVSYRRTDSSDLAEQLYDRLSHEGFEVFLDRFSINPGVNFQKRLYQELADKAMVLCLESPNYQASHWIQLEIAFAKKYRLGLLALNIDNSPKTSSIDEEYRRNILTDPAVKKLTDSSLDTVVSEIKQQHSIALYRMRNYLNSNVIASLEKNGASTSFDKNGFISVLDRSGKNYKIWATPRPPKVKDYHYSDISNALGERVIVGPEFMEEEREVVNAWLSNKSSVDFYTEGKILELANIIYP